ncbi:hypothetical protein K438DRAFT_1772757 [Mycena galopus ATCC 62051]|nr:hypothetical protein K438DRAFT_1772757 [Mycena galopus ATCC 62051]
MPDTSANPTGAQMDRRTSTNRSPVVDECRCICPTNSRIEHWVSIVRKHAHHNSIARMDLYTWDCETHTSGFLGKRVRILPTSACYIAHYKGRSWLRARCMRCSIEFGDGPVLRFGPCSGYGPIARLPCPTAQCSTKTRKLFWLVWLVGLVSDLLVENSSQPVVLSACGSTENVSRYIGGEDSHRLKFHGMSGLIFRILASLILGDRQRCDDNRVFDPYHRGVVLGFGRARVYTIWISTPTDIVALRYPVVGATVVASVSVAIFLVFTNILLDPV